MNRALLTSLLLLFLAVQGVVKGFKFEILDAPQGKAPSGAPPILLDDRLLKFIPEGFLPYPKRLILQPEFRESSMIAKENTAHDLCEYVTNLMLLVSRKTDLSNFTQKVFFLNGLPECSFNPSGFSDLSGDRIPMTFVFLKSSPSLQNFRVSAHPFLEKMNIGVAVLSETKYDELKAAAGRFNIIADFSIQPSVDYEHVHQVEIFSNLNSLKAYILALSASHFAHKFRSTDKDRMLVRQYTLLGQIREGEGGIDIKNNRYCSPFYGKYCVDLRHYGLVADMDGLMKYIAQIEYQNEMWPDHIRLEFDNLYTNNCLKVQQETLTACLKRTFDELPSKVDPKFAKQIEMITNNQNKEVFTTLLAGAYSQMKLYNLAEEYSVFPATVSVFVDGVRIEGKTTPNSLLKVLCTLRNADTGLCSPTLVYRPKIETTVPTYPYKNITVVFTLILTVSVVLYTVSPFANLRSVYSSWKPSTRTAPTQPSSR